MFIVEYTRQTIRNCFIYEEGRFVCSVILFVKWFRTIDASAILLIIILSFLLIGSFVSVDTCVDKRWFVNALRDVFSESFFYMISSAFLQYLLYVTDEFLFQMRVTSIS